MWSWTIWNLTWQCSLFSLNFSHLPDSHTPERDDIISLGNVWLEKDEKAVEMQPVLFMNLSVITDHFFFPHDIWHTFSIASKPCGTGQIEISDAVYLAWISAISWTCIAHTYISRECMTWEGWEGSWHLGYSLFICDQFKLLCLYLVSLPTSSLTKMWGCKAAAWKSHMQKFQGRMNLEVM